MILFSIITCLYLVFSGCVAGRLDGGGQPDETTQRALIMFPFFIACIPFAGPWGLLALVGAFGIATGHGQYFLDCVIKAISPEFFDFFVRLFFGADPRTNEKYAQYQDDAWITAPQSVKDQIYVDMQYYGVTKLYWRGVFGMFVTGTIVGLPAFIIAMVFGQMIGCIFLLTGVVKSVSYMVSHAVFKNTEGAEYLNGGGRNALCLIVAIISIVI